MKKDEHRTVRRLEGRNPERMPTSRLKDLEDIVSARLHKTSHNNANWRLISASAFQCEFWQVQRCTVVSVNALALVALAELLRTQAAAFLP